MNTYKGQAKGQTGTTGHPPACGRPQRSSGKLRSASLHPQSLLRDARGMTLPEILTAVAILSILFALLIMPMMKAFGYIHTGNVRIGVQSASRSAFESIIREISDANYIYDNIDDPTLSSLIFTLAQGVGVNANQDPAPSNGPQVQLLLQPGGVGYGTGVPIHVHYQLALTRPGVLDGTGEVTSPLSYWNEWEMENVDLRNAGLDQSTVETMKDNLYRLVRAEYYPSSVDPSTLPVDSGTGKNPAAAFILSQAIKTDSYGYSASSPDNFREPGWLIDDSLLPAGANGKTAGYPSLRCTLGAAKRRARLERSGLLTAVTPKLDVDTAWVTYTPPSQTGTGSGVWAAQPLVKFETLAVSNESLDAVRLPGQTYPSTYRADYGHWQWKRRKMWSNPGITQEWARYFQTFDVQVRQRYGGAATRVYYASLGRDDVASTAAKDENGDSVLDPHYYVWRFTGTTAQIPGTGVWPAADRPTFDMTRYKAHIEAFRQGQNWESPAVPQDEFWTSNNPYDTRLLPTLTGADTDPPYWPEMAYLLDVERGSVEFRVDAPVRPPLQNSGGGFEPQPPGPLAPFQAPYYGSGKEAVAAPGNNKFDWVIRDVDRAANATNYRNSDGTSWIRVVPETMRIMVGQPRDPSDVSKGYAWSTYTRVAAGTLPDPGQFSFDTLNGLLTFSPREPVWTADTKIRAWYQLQTNIQRASNTAPLNSTDGTSVTASYFTKEVLRLTLGLRAYDPDTGKAQPFQLAATVRPRNLR